ncbi:MAG: hypothetical protein Q7U39_04165 [Nitrospira sp.]|nr:hypothetical protein [Nitrospira sp.]
MAMKVTFDSNVWRAVADPNRFPNDPMHTAIQRIHNAIRSGQFEGLLAETVFTLEGIKKVDRKAFFTQYRTQSKISEEEQPDGSIRLGIKMGPDPNAHPGNNPYLASHLNDALGVGFKLMRCHRVAGVQNPDLRNEWFSSHSSSSVDTAKKFGEVGRKIEATGAGIAHIKAIGNRYASPTQPWFEGLAVAPASEDAAIARAVAEWADGDCISAHIAYSNDFMCTRDTATAAGSNSVFSASNRAWLTSQYGVRFVNPSELASHI